ncbi:MAG TPA: IS4 family transposase [Bacteroidales bacterium]|nr:IS4 family transposase [Bacteroidales bacterium]HQL69890.1 IS4 family transposase [Bacteroidales bacterium]
MDTRVESKNSILIETLFQTFGKEMNLARIKFFGLFICGLCKVQTVCFEKIAASFDTDVLVDSSLRRIQNFMAGYALDTNLIARLIFALLPHQPPYRLAMDRTNWKFGTVNINILVLAVVYHGVAFPVLFRLMPKFGNSSTNERIELMQRYINLFGVESIDCLLADREFVGEHWLKYLNCNTIRYHIRIRENFWVDIPKNGHRVKASWLFSYIKINQSDFYRRIVSINGQYCYLSASKVRNKQGIPELQIIVSFNKPNQAQTLYKERWQIESAFKALKSSGFNIEDTHLTDIERIDKLFALVLVAFVWAYKAGIFLESICPIKIKTHGRKAKSTFKYGLVYIANILFRNDLEEFQTCCKFLSCT